MDTCARIEVCAEYFLLSVVAQKHVSATFRCAFFNVIDVLCDWVYEDVIQGDALKSRSESV